MIACSRDDIGISGEWEVCGVAMWWKLVVYAWGSSWVSVSVQEIGV